ncbi:MAG: methyltransferase domain-containing protein [Steroidobacteraceae bacterium]|nr:methyltransferase domain-containing protein [Steroidobacteraceae bacterium]
MLARRVEAELRDGLSATDPVAERSRRDLQRVHRFMRTRARLLRTLRQLVPAPAKPLRVLELGAGDGSLLLGVARELAPVWPAVELTLLDRLALVDGATVAEYARYGWTARSSVMDVFDWARAATGFSADAASRWDVVIANLFLHHFDDTHLALLLGAIAASTDEFVAFEPRRGWRALAGSHLIGGLGANTVTRTDAVLSVHAGFRDLELTALWPNAAAWRLQEHASGTFSHCFRATLDGTQ